MGFGAGGGENSCVETSSDSRGERTYNVSEDKIGFCKLPGVLCRGRGFGICKGEKERKNKSVEAWSEG